MTVYMLESNGCFIVVGEFKSWHDILHLLINGIAPKVGARPAIYLQSLFNTLWQFYSVFMCMLPVFVFPLLDL